MRRAWLVIPLIAVALALLVASRRQPQPYFVSGFLEADEIRVGSRVGGRVATVLAAEGMTVEPGTALAMLDAYDLEERLAQARATLAARAAQRDRLNAGFRAEEIEQARARRDRARAVLDRLVAGARPLEIQILENKLEYARAQFVKAEIEHARIEKLYAEGRAAKEEMDEVTRVIDSARAAFNVARDELALAREGTRAEEIAEARAVLAENEQALALLEKGFRTEEIAEAVANVDAARAAIAALERQRDELTIRAPSACVVEAIDLQPGDLVPANAPVISLMDATSLWVRAYVPENRLNLALDQPVLVRVDSFPGRFFAGRISFVARQAEFTPANIQTPEERSKQVFRIKVRLDEGREVLRPGMSADVFLDPVP